MVHGLDVVSFFAMLKSRASGSLEALESHLEHHLEVLDILMITCNLGNPVSK